MEPTPKSPDIESLLTRLAGGRSRTNAIRSNECVFCEKPASFFKDALSEREYTISGMCQECQDETFGKHAPECQYCGGDLTPEMGQYCPECS